MGVRAFVVLQRRYSASYAGKQFWGDDTPGCGWPVRAFLDAGRAAAFARAEDYAARRGRNPFHYHCITPAERDVVQQSWFTPGAVRPDPLAYQSRFDAGRLHDWLLDHGLTPPRPAADGTRDWAKWFGRGKRAMTEAQRAAVWEALDRVRFFDVIAAELPDGQGV